MTNRPTKEPHFGKISEMQKTEDFDTAYEAICASPEKIYTTVAGTLFTAEAGSVSKGSRRGQQVIIFKQEGREMSRSYKCCWSYAVNCNRTYIDSYTPVI